MSSGTAPSTDSESTGDRTGGGGLLWAIRGILALGFCLLVYGAVGSAVLLPEWAFFAKTPLREEIVFVVEFAGFAAAITVAALIARRNRNVRRLHDPRLPRSRIMTVLAFAGLGVVVALVAGLVVPLPAAVLHFQLENGPVGGPDIACADTQDTHGLELPGTSVVSVTWRLTSSGAHAWVNATSPSGTLVYQGGPATNGSGAFAVPGSGISLYYLQLDVAYCHPGPATTLIVWVNATQSGPLL